MTDATQTQTAATPAPDTHTVVDPAAPALSESVKMKFRFRKDKKLGTQRAPVELDGVQVPTISGLIDIINSDGFDKAPDGKPTSKPLQWVMELMQDAVRGSVGNWVSDDEKASQATFEPAKYTFGAIAVQPREDRRASSISDEDWEAFAADYIEIMPALTNKTKDNITNAVTVYRKKFSIVKTDKAVLNLLKGQLALYVENTKNGEEFSEILDMLTHKVDMYLGQDDVQQLIANL